MAQDGVSLTIPRLTAVSKAPGQPNTAIPFRNQEGVDSRKDPLRDVWHLRAGRSQFKTASAPILTDNSPMVVDLQGPPVGTHWIIWDISFMCLATVKAQAVIVAPPFCGLFFVRQGEIVESLADASNANIGINFQARDGLLVPTRFTSQAIGTGQQITFVRDVYGDQVIVPAGWTIRAIVNCNPGNAAPGPGAGSTGFLCAQVTPEVDAGTS